MHQSHGKQGHRLDHGRQLDRRPGQQLDQVPQCDRRAGTDNDLLSTHRRLNLRVFRDHRARCELPPEGTREIPAGLQVAASRRDRRERQPLCTCSTVTAGKASSAACCTSATAGQQRGLVQHRDHRPGHQLGSSSEARCSSSTTDQTNRSTTCQQFGAVQHRDHRPGHQLDRRPAVRPGAVARPAPTADPHQAQRLDSNRGHQVGHLQRRDRRPPAQHLRYRDHQQQQCARRHGTGSTATAGMASGTAPAAPRPPTSPAARPPSRPSVPPGAVARQQAWPPGQRPTAARPPASSSAPAAARPPASSATGAAARPPAGSAPTSNATGSNNNQPIKKAERRPEGRRKKGRFINLFLFSSCSRCSRSVPVLFPSPNPTSRNPETQQIRGLQPDSSPLFPLFPFDFANSAGRDRFPTHLERVNRLHSLRLASIYWCQLTFSSAKKVAAAPIRHRQISRPPAIGRRCTTTPDTKPGAIRQAKTNSRSRWTTPGTRPGEACKVRCDLRQVVRSGR